MKTLLLIDANSLIHRCFHALPPFTNKDGKPTGALYGLASILLKITREQKPDFIAALFDRPEPTFRKEIFKEYKIHRPKAPDDLVSQIIEARNLFNAFQVKSFEAPGFEADDLIGTMAEKFKKIPDLKIIILTGDLDTLQLIEDGDDKIVVETFKKGISDTIIYNEAAVRERFGVKPSQMPDYKGLVGDSSDNIPGVAGVGPKTAAALINKYGAIENILEKAGSEKAYKKIFESQDQALFSRKLATIRRDAPINEDLDGLRYSGLPKEKATAYFLGTGFRSLIDRINKTDMP